MGIENRDYYRTERDNFGWGEGRRGSGWSAVTWIIVVTVGVFILQLMLGRSFTEAFQLDHLAVQRGEVWRLLTYAALHSVLRIWHIVFNMWVFHMAGSDFEARRGSRELVAFYIAAALFGGLAIFGWECVLDWRGRPPLIVDGKRFVIGTVGASGAVMGALMVQAFTSPRDKILLFGVLPMTMMTFAVGVIVIDTIPILKQLVQPGRISDNISHAGHLGGIAFGILYQKRGWRVTNWLPNPQVLRTMFRRRPALRVHRPTDAPTDFGPNFERRVDGLLEKIAQSGEASLTAEEREVLMEASRRARGRRSS